MKQSDIVEVVAKASGLSKYRIGKVFAELKAVILEGLDNQESIPLFGIGKLKEIYVKERKGYNPHTGGNMIIKDHVRVKFTQSSMIKKRGKNRKKINLHIKK